MSSRGRGRGYSSRGGYENNNRGYSSYRGSSYRGGGGGRGSYSDRGGRGSYYGTSERYNSGGDRYSSGRNDRSDDMGFKRSYRSDGPSSYGVREHVGRGSPERKRIRMEGSSGGRRSHDGSNHYGSSPVYSGRHESYSTERRGGYIEQRRSPSYRKSGNSMPPPRSPPGVSRIRGSLRASRSGPSLRRSYRGRIIRSSRGSYRGAPRIRGYSLTSRIRRLSKPPLKRQSDLDEKYGSGSSSEAEESLDIEDKKKIVEDKAETPAKVPAVKHEDGGEEEEATDKEAVDAASGDEQDPLPQSKVTGRSFIRLTCAHCREKCVTFKVYAKHLKSSKHRYVMDDVALKLKLMLQRMRTTQRNNQRVLEDSDTAEYTNASLYCPLCKLIYRTTRQSHYRSECHRNMKKFLMPYCRVCEIAFRSPMVYEHHICSLEHIKKKARVDGKPQKPIKVEGVSDDEGMDVDLDNFMTLDSVGDVDEVNDDIAGEKKTEDGVEKPKVEISIGNEHIKKVEVFYCDLCQKYLPRTSESEDLVVRRHCRLRTHMSRYVRFRDDRTLRRHAERIHRIHRIQRQQAKEGAADAKDGNAETTAVGEATTALVKVEGGTPKENGGAVREEEGEGDDKLWADVDKELGDLLREVNQTGNKSSDDEEDSNTGRYDRFRKSDKKPEINDANTTADSAISEDTKSAKAEPEIVPISSAEAAKQ